MGTLAWVSKQLVMKLRIELEMEMMPLLLEMEKRMPWGCCSRQPVTLLGCCKLVHWLRHLHHQHNMSATTQSQAPSNVVRLYSLAAITLNHNRLKKGRPKGWCVEPEQERTEKRGGSRRAVSIAIAVYRGGAVTTSLQNASLNFNGRL